MRRYNLTHSTQMMFYFLMFMDSHLYHKDGPVDGTYILPPIRYPDGHWYLKLGHSKNFETKLNHDEVAMREWYGSGGNKEAVAYLTKFLSTNLIPNLNVINVKNNCCITTRVRCLKE